MRPILDGDLEAATRAVLHLPDGARAGAVRQLLDRASAADTYRKRMGRAHPLWGNGSLMAAARRGPLPPRPHPGDLRYCRALAEVLEAVIAWRCARAALNRPRS